MKPKTFELIVSHHLGFPFSSSSSPPRLPAAPMTPRIYALLTSCLFDPPPSPSTLPTTDNGALPPLVSSRPPATAIYRPVHCAPPPPPKPAPLPCCRQPSRLLPWPALGSRVHPMQDTSYLLLVHGEDSLSSKTARTHLVPPLRAPLYRTPAHHEAVRSPVPPWTRTPLVSNPSTPRPLLTAMHPDAVQTPVPPWTRTPLVSNPSTPPPLPTAGHVTRLPLDLHPATNSLSKPFTLALTGLNTLPHHTGSPPLTVPDRTSHASTEAPNSSRSPTHAAAATHKPHHQPPITLAASSANANRTPTSTPHPSTTDPLLPHHTGPPPLTIPDRTSHAKTEAPNFSGGSPSTTNTSHRSAPPPSLHPPPVIHLPPPSPKRSRWEAASDTTPPYCPRRRSREEYRSRHPDGSHPRDRRTATRDRTRSPRRRETGSSGRRSRPPPSPEPRTNNKASKDSALNQE